MPPVLELDLELELELELDPALSPSFSSPPARARARARAGARPTPSFLLLFSPGVSGGGRIRREGEWGMVDSADPERRRAEAWQRHVEHEGVRTR